MRSINQFQLQQQLDYTISTIDLAHHAVSLIHLLWEHLCQREWPNVRCAWMTCELWHYHRALLPFVIRLLYNKHTRCITYIRVQVVFVKSWMRSCVSVITRVLVQMTERFSPPHLCKTFGHLHGCGGENYLVIYTSGCVGYLHMRGGENLLVIYTCTPIITETLYHAFMIWQKTTEQVFIK